MKNSFSARFFLPLLSAIVALNPLAVDMYLAAMPAIAVDLKTSIATIQNSLSTYLIGFALGLLTFGPLSDQLPRRYFVFFGAGSFMLLNLLLSQVESSGSFLSLRFLQAFCGSAAMVVIPTLIKENYPGSLAKGMSYVVMMMMVAPLIAPFLGGSLLLIGDWRLIFISLGLYAGVILLLAKLMLPQTAPTVITAKKLSFFKQYHIVLSDKTIRYDLLSTMLNSLTFFTYITGSSFIFIELFELSASEFSLLLALNVSAYLSGSFINTKIVGRVGSRRLLQVATTFAMLATTLALLSVVLELGLWYFAGALYLMIGCISLIGVSCDALILIRFREQTGTATGIIGTLKFSSGALVGPLLALTYNGSALPFAVLIVLATGTIGALQYYRANHSKSALNEVVQLAN